MSTLHVTIDNHTYTVELKPSGRGGEVYDVVINGQSLSVTLPHPTATVAEMEWLIVDGRPYEIVADPTLQWINAYDGLHTVDVQDANQRVSRPRSGDGRVKAPIPGLITRILVEPGAAVAAGQAMLILEAMKMENEIRAPFDGVVSSLSVVDEATVVRNKLNTDSHG